MRARISLGLVLLAALGTGVALQRGAVTRLEKEHQALVAGKAEAERLALENQELQRLREEARNLDSWRAANRDLPRLRNEVRQLREQRPELEKLRGENQRLAGEIKALSGPRRPLAEMDGYIAQEQCANAGFATPEAAAQSWFRALQQGDLRELAKCLEPRERERLLKEWEQQPEPRKPLQEFERVARLKGFRIAEKTVAAEDKVILGLQFVAGGEILKLPVRRFGREWKIEEL